MGSPWFDRLSDVLPRTRATSYSAPFFCYAANVAGVQIRRFGPYDAGSGNWRFSTSMLLDAPAASEAAHYLGAMMTGTMHYAPRAGGGPGDVTLVPSDVAGGAVARAAGALPYWYPRPAYIKYVNVAPAAAREAALLALSTGNELNVTLERVRWMRSDKNFTATAAQLADMWLRGEIGILVLAGAKVGEPGASSIAGRVHAEVFMLDRFTPAPITYYNPAYYMALWRSMRLLMSVNENALLPALTDTSAPPAATGNLRFVSASGSATAPYTTPATASHTIAAAVAAADNGDTVLILDRGTYNETVIIDKPISLTSTGTSQATDATLDYPTLDGTHTLRPILIRNVNSGVAHVSKLLITQGRAPDTFSATSGILSGAGILVERLHNVVISSCVVRGCEAPALGTRNYADGFGGGICAYHSSPAIVGCLIEDNHAGYKGCGIGVFGYGWPAIFDCIIRRNTPSGSAEAGGDGGGIAISTSVSHIEDPTVMRSTLESLGRSLDHRIGRSDILAAAFNTAVRADVARAQSQWVRIVGCRVEHNSARDDGGGIYVTSAANARIVDTEVVSNRAEEDGGGVRATFGSRLVMIGCRVSQNRSNALIDSDETPALRTGGSGGGGISARNIKVLTLRQTVVEQNVAIGWAGGGLYCLSTDEGRIIPLPPLLSTALMNRMIDYNHILLDIYGFTDMQIEIDEQSNIDANRATRIPGEADHGKGGGIYILRWRGARGSSLGELDGRPLRVEISNADILRPTNSGSFPNANRLYLQDMTVTPQVVRDDRDLSAGAPFRYP